MRPPAALTLKQLRALRAVVDCSRISAAADALALSAPAVHGQIKALEANFGCKMLSRARSGRFVPTAEGRIALAAHEKITVALSSATYEIDALKRGIAGVVNLGVVSTGRYFGPGIVAALKRHCPEIEVQLRIGNREQIVSDLESGRIALAITGRPPSAPPVRAQNIGRHPHVLIAACDHALAACGEVRREQILAERVILREEGSGVRALTTWYLDQLGHSRAYDTIEMESNETVKQAVIAGLGISLISAHTVIEEVRAGRLCVLSAPEMPLYRQWFLIHLEDEHLSGVASVVRDHITANCTELLLSRQVEEVLAKAVFRS